MLKQYNEGKTNVDAIIDSLMTYEYKLVELGIESENRFKRLKGLEQDYKRTLLVIIQSRVLFNFSR